MAGWFDRLMQKGHTRPARSIGDTGLPQNAEVGNSGMQRDPRYDALVAMLREREAQDREAREKRQRWYKQHLPSDPTGSVAGSAPEDAGELPPIRLQRFRTKVPCRATHEARKLLDDLSHEFPGATVTFPRLANGDRAVMLTPASGTASRQIGWLEHQAESDPALCNVRNHGLSVETDGGRMLVLRFTYPPTAVRMSSAANAMESAPAHRARRAEDGSTPGHRARRIEDRVAGVNGGDRLALSPAAVEEVSSVDFTEIRPALELRPSDRSSAPRLVWVTRPEAEMLDALASRDYEAFYVRFKLEVLAGIWSSLSGVLSTLPGAQWHQGAHYTVVREADAAKGKIHQRTVDDGGRTVDIGADRVYDAFPATDILLLYLEGDILADFADVYFTLQGSGSADAYHLKEEFFTIIRRFWAASQSLASCYGSDLAAVLRMAQRALPMPAQVALLKQDWTNLRQSIVDRYGEAGRKALDLSGEFLHRRRIGPAAWPFATFPAGDINVGLRFVYRQEWRNLGPQRGDIIRTIRGVEDLSGAEKRVETTIEHGGTPMDLDTIVNESLRATIGAMNWPMDLEGSVDMGVRGLGVTTDMGLEPECRERSRDASTRLSDVMLRMASRARDEIPAAVISELVEPGASTDDESPERRDGATRVHSKLQNRYEVITRIAEIHNVVLVAEKLPAPGEVDLDWVKRHDWILAKALLDESFRTALESVGEDSASLLEHIRANILHYQRAIWRQEDPQQRSMRYRKSGRKVPLEWRFEIESGAALTIDELGERLASPNVDGQFAAYSDGRQADLDHVIDSAGLIGYYANYAIYRMRPEFGSEDSFSMLHFFKSPYLRPSPASGEPEVADPAQIDMPDDVFRQERARRIVLESDSIVIDVIRRAGVAAPAAQDGDAELPRVPEGFQLVAESGPQAGLLTVTARREETVWPIVLGGGLLAGAGGGAPRMRESGVAWAITATGMLAAGSGTPPARPLDTDAGRLLLGDGERARALIGSGASVGTPERVIVVRDSDTLRPTPIAGTGQPAPAQQLLTGQ